MSFPSFATHSLSLGVNSSRTIELKNVTRVAVGNSKILKVQALPPSKILVIGKLAGLTMVRAWDSQGRESSYSVRVVASEADSNSAADGREVVKVALEFLEIDEAFNKHTGFQWPETLQFAGLAALTGTSAMSGINYEVGLTSARGWIHHLVKEGWAKVVANPDLYVRLGEEAAFHSGGEFPVASSNESYGRALKHVEWKSFGLTAKVRPQSVDKLHISSDINLELSELNTSQTIEGLPSLTKRRLVTKMNSIDGETVILSGLVKRNSSSEKDSLPILGSIPVLGSLLFSSTRKVAEDTELLMAVTFSMSTKSQEENRMGQMRKKWEKARD